jgi:HSP20 family molecular chaperone IbpA
MLTLYRDWGFGSPDVSRWFSDIDAAERSLRAAFDAHLPRTLASRGASRRPGLFDGEHELVFRAELPGVTPEDLDVSLERDALTVRGTWPQHELESRIVHRRGRRAGAFSTRISLPCEVDAECVVASLEDGVLTVSLPKRTASAPRRIPVRAGERSTP